jgi:hypothetical protein
LDDPFKRRACQGDRALTGAQLFLRPLHLFPPRIGSFSWRKLWFLIGFDCKHDRSIVFIIRAIREPLMGASGPSSEQLMIIRATKDDDRWPKTRPGWQLPEHLPGTDGIAGGLEFVMLTV